MHIMTAHLHPETPRYPAVDQGFPVTSIDDMLATQGEILARIRVATGSKQDYETYILPVIQAYARFVHLLPASRGEHFRGAGGLFAMGLNVGFYSMQATDSLIFSARERTEDKPLIEPAWKWAAFFAGLCSEISLALTDLTVANHKGDEWPVYLLPLYDWCRDQAVAKYFVRWREPVRRHQALTTFYDISKIIPQGILQNLQNISPRIVAALMDAITGIADITASNKLAQTVRRIRVSLIERDMKSNAMSYGAVMVGNHLEPYLIGAMRHLLRCGDWTVNESKSRIWYSQEGMFVIWPVGAREILALLEKQQIVGTPRDPDTIADILERSGAVLAEPTHRYWELRLPTEGDTPFRAIKIADPAILFAAHGEWTMEPIDEHLISGASRSPEEAPAAPKVTVPKRRTKRLPQVDSPTPQDQESLPLFDGLGSPPPNVQPEGDAEPPCSEIDSRGTQHMVSGAAGEGSGPPQTESRPTPAASTDLATDVEPELDISDSIRRGGIVVEGFAEVLQEAFAKDRTVFPVVGNGLAVSSGFVEQNAIEFDVLSEKLVEIGWIEKPAEYLSFGPRNDFGFVLKRSVVEGLHLE